MEEKGNFRKEGANEHRQSRLFISSLSRSWLRPSKARFVILAVVAFIYLIWMGHLDITAVSPYLATDTELSESKKARLREVADLLLEIYEELAELRYLNPQGIKRGPHNITDIQPEYEELNLDPSVIYLYSVLPYIDVEKAGQADFFHGGSFVDFLDPGDVEDGRDPFMGSPDDENFEDENGPYMRPWVTPLTKLGNHQSVMVYDARKHRIWIIDQEGWCTTDPALEDVPEKTSKSPNRNNFDHIPSRSATHVLKDIKRWYHTLEILPGGGEYSGLEWNDEDMDLPSIYKACGWPDHFDGDSFEVSQARKYVVLGGRYHAEEPLRQVENRRQRISGTDHEIQHRKTAILEAKSVDDLWMAKFRLAEFEWMKPHLSGELIELEQVAERFCPGGKCQKEEDLPLWELVGLKGYCDPEYHSEDLNLDPQPDLSSLHGDARQHEVYRRACKAALADCERLLPGISTDSLPNFEAFHEENRDEMDKKLNEWRRQKTELLESWFQKIPQTAPKARERVESELKELQVSMEKR